MVLFFAKNLEFINIAGEENGAEVFRDQFDKEMKLGDLNTKAGNKLCFVMKMSIIETFEMKLILDSNGKLDALKEHLLSR